MPHRADLGCLSRPKGSPVPLHDRQEFNDWIARREAREIRIHGEPNDPTICIGCDQTAEEQTIRGGYCLECLAFDYGAASTSRRIARVTERIAGTFARGATNTSTRLVEAILERLEDALDDFDHAAARDSLS